MAVELVGLHSWKQGAMKKSSLTHEIAVEAVEVAGLNSWNQGAMKKSSLTGKFY